MDVGHDLAVYVPAKPYDEDTEAGLFSRFEPDTRTLPAGFQVQPRFQPLPVDIVLDKDVAVTLRDGVKIYVDVLRPAGSQKVPVIVAWSPYGKSRGHDPAYIEMFKVLGMDIGLRSGLMKFEGPDPAFWCAQGYAVCHPDPRGSFRSEGDIRVWSRSEAKDYHDLIEWLAIQEWCNGKVGTTGNSYLAISQWFVAAERPAHLAAIAPWEGMSDVYRDLTLRGGIPDYPFSRQFNGNLAGKSLREDLVGEADRYPLRNELWESHTAELELIDVPAYIVASYSNSIHTPGTFRGWRNIASTDKWLRIHNTMEWPDYYEDSNVHDLLRFFDHYLKGVDNSWRETPRVRYSILTLDGNDRINVPANEFPPEDSEEAKYYLESTSNSLSVRAPTASGSASYAANSEDGQVSFTVRVDEPTEFVGYPKVRLWVESDGSDDLDLFVFLQKLNAAGEQLEQITVPNHGPIMQQLTRVHGSSILNYRGSNGRLRVSMRHLDATSSTDEIPVHTFDRVEKLAEGEVACVDIEMFPIALALNPGEQLRLVISGQHIFGGVILRTENVVSDINQGRHVIHTGDKRASYLQIRHKSLARA